MEQTIKSMVDNPHFLYKKYKNYWDFLLRSYEGGVDYIQADVPISSDSTTGIKVTYNGKVIDHTHDPYNLFMHKKERSEDYAERLRMSYYYNFCAPIIDIYTNHLFRQPVVVDYGSIKDLFALKADNIDRKGSNMDEFRRELSETAQIFGHCFVLTDMPQDMGELSLAQRISNDRFPYFKIYYPQNVINWSLDEFGQPYWVLLQEQKDGNADWKVYDHSNRSNISYTLWTRDEWKIYNKDYELVDEGVHKVGRVPLDIIYEKPSKKYKNFLGVSVLADIAFIARDVYNKCSELNEIIRNQTFSFLAIQGKSSDYDEIEVGTSKAILYPEGMSTPSYVSPPSDNANILMTQIDKQVTKMFKLAKLEDGSASADKQVDVQSGVAKAYDFHETNAALSKKASHMEDGELRMLSTFAAWEGKEFDGSVQYSRDFNVKDLWSDLDEAEKSFKLQMGETFQSKIKENIIKKKFPRATEEEVKKMLNEATETVEESNSFGSQLRQRLPNFFNNKNALPGGQNGGS